MSALSFRLTQYALLMRLNRPIGILLLWWPTAWALWFASKGRPDWHVFVVFTLGVVLMRSAGCVINDYADRDFDPHVERTRDRPIAAGRVRPREALLLAVALSLIAFALVLTLNPLTVWLSVVGAMLAATYPFLKRYTHLPQFYLGAAFGWSIPMAFAAQTGSVPDVAWVLFAANVCWSVAYDTAYAMVDRDDDLRVGVKSTAILFGKYDRFMIGAFHMAALSLLVVTGIVSQRGAIYYGGLVLAALLAMHQQWSMRQRTRDSYFRAFLANNYFGAAVFAGLAMDFWLKRVLIQ